MSWQYDQGWMKFKEQWYEMSDINLNLYKQTQMYRRVNSFLIIEKIKDYETFLRQLGKDKVLFSKFSEYLTINVTEFFRTPESFKELKSVIMPILIKQASKNPLKIWSAGCSVGAEPYSVAIILYECNLPSDYWILATDINERTLAKAKAGGPYLASEMKNVPKDIVEKYFIKTKQGYMVVDEIKEKVVFKKHNLLQDYFDKAVDLILCRNVLIYFTQEAKKVVYDRFYRSLKANGVLFIGGTETIVNFRDIGYRPIRPFFYQKKSES